MGYWIFMTLMELLIPAVMIGCGLWFVKKPPARINYALGYRTRRSMMNKDTWDFAHRYCGKVWIVLGIIMIPVDIIAMVTVLGKTTLEIGNFSTVLLFVQIIPLLLTFFIVEGKLKHTFDDYGRRRG